MNFETYEGLVKPGQSDRAYYAQVGNRRPPYGKGEQLLNALGAGSPAALTRCRTLLSLPDEVWQVGDDLSLPEDTLLQVAKMPEPEAISYVQELVEKFSTRKLFDENGSSTNRKLRGTAPDAGKSVFATPVVKRDLKYLQSLKEQPQDTKSVREVKKRINSIREWLDTIEASLSS